MPPMTKYLDPIADIDRANKNGMTLRSIADAVGCNASTLWRIQKGSEPSLAMAQKLHDVACRSAALALKRKRA